MDPILVKLWNLAGQPDPHPVIETTALHKLGDIPMTVVPHDQFMRFIGTMQLLLIKLRPNFYTQSYLKEMKFFKERQPKKKEVYTLTDFCDQVYRLFGADIIELTFEDVMSDIRAVHNEIYSTSIV